MACFQPLIEAQNNKMSADDIPLIFRQFYVTLMATPQSKIETCRSFLGGIF